jgi:predicted RNA polymerase sigma factor
MRIQYNGDNPVDIPGVDEVEPGDVVDVDDEVGESLLAAGTAYPDEGDPIKPKDPLWSSAKSKPLTDRDKRRADRAKAADKAATTETAEAEKESAA